MQINLLASVFTFALIGAYQPASCLKSGNADPRDDVTLPAQIVYVAFQETLELNCSVENLCKKLVSSDHILWKHNNTWIQNSTHIVNNNTVQLRRKMISFEDAGVYECSTTLNCSQHVKVHPRIVTVVVGVKPPKPTKPKVEVLGMPPQNVTITWTARHANWTSEIRIGVRKNAGCVYTFSLCKQRPSIAYEMLSCSVEHSVLEKLFPRKHSASATNSSTTHNRRDTLCVMVKVSNAFGFSFSRELWCNLNHATRCPAPRDFRVAVGDQNVTASWLRPLLVLSNYPLLYHLEYRTKSLLGRIPEKPQALDFEEGDTVMEDMRITYPITSDLVPYTKYEFRLCCSFFSLEFGPDIRTEVTTMEAAPSEAPVIDSCGMKKESLKSCHSDVLVAWKRPPNNTWNGHPRKFAAHYWQDIPSYKNESQVDFNGSATEGVLKDVNACKNVTIRLRMCTKGGCGPLSRPCFIRAKNDTSKDDLRDGQGSLEGNQEKNLNIWLAVAVGIFAGLVLAVVAIGCLRRKRLRKRRQRRLSDLVGPLNDFHRYENELDDRPSVCEVSEEYDEVVICDSMPLLKDIAGGVGRIPVTRI